RGPGDEAPRPGRELVGCAGARRLRPGVQPGRIDVRAGPARAAGVGATEHHPRALPGEPHPPLPCHARQLPGDGPRLMVDYRDTPEEATFRTRLRAWLEDNNPHLPPSSTSDEYWERQPEWHRGLHRGG